MKKLLIILIFTAVISPVFSQDNTRDATGNMHYINVQVERIFYTGQGYVVQYRKGVNQIGTIGIPYDWFTAAGGKAEILKLPAGGNWPSMSVFYKDGAFSYVRLYVHSQRTHQTWSVVPQGADVSRHFKEPEDFKIEF